MDEVSSSCREFCESPESSVIVDECCDCSSLVANDESSVVEFESSSLVSNTASTMWLPADAAGDKRNEFVELLCKSSIAVDECESPECGR